MSHGAALVILVVCFVLAFALCLPFLYLARRWRKSKGTPGVTSSRVIPRAELPTLVAFAAVMFFGFTYAFTEPETWFGKLMATNTGRLAFLVGPALAIVVLRSAWLRLTRPRSGAKPQDERSDA